MKKTKQSNIPTTAIAVIITAIVISGVLLMWHYNQVENLTSSTPTTTQKALSTTTPKQAPKITAVQTKEEELDGPTEDAAGASPLPFTYTKESVALKIYRSALSEYHTPETLAARSKKCGSNKSEEYFKTLFSKFSADEKATAYSFYAHGNDLRTSEAWSVMVIPNKLGYKTLEDFKKDFEACAAAAYDPAQVTPQYLLFTSNCGGALLDIQDQPVRCEQIREQIEPSLKLR